MLIYLTLLSIPITKKSPRLNRPNIGFMFDFEALGVGAFGEEFLFLDLGGRFYIESIVVS